MIGRLVYVTSLERRHGYRRALRGQSSGRNPDRKGEDALNRQGGDALSQRHYLPPSPKRYQWQPGEPVVLAILTAAGWMASGRRGTLVRLVERRKAEIAWEKPGISSIVAVVRLRPLWLVTSDFR